MDFGHTSVKRGVTVYNDGALAAIEVLEPLDAPWPEKVGEGVIHPGRTPRGCGAWQ